MIFIVLNQFARIFGTEYFLPSGVITNGDLNSRFPDWSAQKIGGKTGIEVRHIAGESEFTSDLAAGACEKIFDRMGLDQLLVEYLIVCTQSPDFYLPTTAALVHESLGLRSYVGATNINLGCSGFVYGLGLTKGLIESGQFGSVLLDTSDSYSKFLNPEDRSVRTVFGDGAAAAFIDSGATSPAITGLVFGSDGSGTGNLIMPSGGLRSGEDFAPAPAVSSRGLKPSDYDLFMNGPATFNFTLDVVPMTVDQVLRETGLTLDDIDLFVFHQADKFMLDHLRQKPGIPEEKFFISLANNGNTVSCAIPIALTDAVDGGALEGAMTILVLGFGVGYSWAGGLVGLFDGLMVRWF